MVELMNGITKGYSPKVYFTDDENGLQGFRTINCTEELHPFAGAYWPPGHIFGYEHTFINLPNFEDGVIIQAVLTAVEQSANTKKWVEISEIYKPKENLISL
jgi:hypothetical protein